MLYLHLYHGRIDPEQDMDDWGTKGPTFEIESGIVFSTYAVDIKWTAPDGDCPRFLNYLHDMIYYNGVYYGDFSISDTPRGETPEPFEQWRAILPMVKSGNN